MKAGRGWLLLATGVLLVGAAIGYLMVRQRQPAAPQPATEALPATVHYEFVWPEGATRGIDLPDRIQIDSIHRSLPLYPVGDMRSEPGEELVAFLQRVRAEMVAYSDRQEHEACAQICSDGDRYSVRMTSIGAAAHCAVAPVCLAGQSMHQSIHSHCPGRPGLRATLADQYLSGGSMRSGRYLGRCDTEHFSRQDYAGWRPGWLAGVRALYRQDGPDDITAYK